VDGYQGVAAGVLRGLGRQPTIALVNIFAFWILGIPLGAALAFGARMGIEALWIGISVGLTAGSICFATLLRRVDWSLEAKQALLRSTRVGRGEAAGRAVDSLMQPLRQAENGWPAGEDGR
jgi:MATE family multidrug resistance protein